MDKEYKILLERSVRNEEQMINAVTANAKIAESISKNLEALNSNVDELNDTVHADIEIVKTYFIREHERLVLYIRYLVLITFTLLATFAGLNVAGLL